MREKPWFRGLGSGSNRHFNLDFELELKWGWNEVEMRSQTCKFSYGQYNQVSVIVVDKNQSMCSDQTHHILMTVWNRPEELFPFFLRFLCLCFFFSSLFSMSWIFASFPEDEVIRKGYRGSRNSQPLSLTWSDRLSKGMDRDNVRELDNFDMLTVILSKQVYSEANRDDK